MGWFWSRISGGAASEEQLRPGAATINGQAEPDVAAVPGRPGPTAEPGSRIPLHEFTPKTWTSPTPPFSRIHYACGLNVLPGWMNVDAFDDALRWHFSTSGGVPPELADNVYSVDLVARHPFADGSFDFAFAEDFIEHIDQKSAILFLEEALRTLKPGGVLRLATPGLAAVMHAHFRNADFDAVVANQHAAFTRWGHVHFFTHESLRTMALALGFRDYRECGFRESQHPALCRLECREEQAASGTNIYAELTK